MKKSIIIVVLVAAMGYFLLSYHIILLDNTVKFVKKTGLRYDDTFIDARGVKKLELLAKPELIEAGIRDALREAGVVEKNFE